MFTMYRTDEITNITEETKEFKKGNWINMIAPTESEIKLVCKKLKIEEDFIRYALDYEEKARIDIEDDDNTILFIIDVPVYEVTNERETGKEEYSTMPFGIIFMRDDYIITVGLHRCHLIEDLEKRAKRDSQSRNH